MKHRIRILLAVGALLALGGCVYSPGYYARPGVVYDDGTTDYAPVDGYAGGYYAPGYYYSDPWCCYGSAWPWFGGGVYGSFYYGGRGHWRGGHGGWHGGNTHAAPRPLPGASAPRPRN